MPSPVLPADFKNVISSPTSTMCGNFINTLLKLPVLLYKLVNYLLDSDGNLQAAFVSAIRKPGEIVIFSYLLPSTNTDYLKCDGQTVSQTAFPALFAVIGHTYDGGSSGISFGVPNITGRFIAGAGGTASTGSSTNVALGVVGGQDTTTLLAAHIPSHAHSYTDGTVGGAVGDLAVGSSDSRPAPGSGLQWRKPTTNGGVTGTFGTTSPTPVPTFPPYIGLYVYIKT